MDRHTAAVAADVRDAHDATSELLGNHYTPKRPLAVPLRVGPDLGSPAAVAAAAGGQCRYCIPAIAAKDADYARQASVTVSASGNGNASGNVIAESPMSESLHNT